MTSAKTGKGRAKGRSRPKSAAELEALRIVKRAQDLEAVGLAPDAAVLETQADIEITRTAEKRDGRTVQENSARRLDAFEALKATMAPGCYDAARRLERDLLIRAGQADRGQPMMRVDGGPDPDHARALRMIAAGDRVDAVLGRLSERDVWLLTELIVGCPERREWRGSVAHITGEVNPNAQGAAVRAACVNLRDGYAAVERRRVA